MLAHLQTGQREVSAGERWYIARTVPYRTADDHIAGVVLTFLDITSREESENALGESEARFRATFEQAAVGIAHVGLDGQWLRVNGVLCEILGFSRAELLQRTFQDVTHPEELAADLTDVAQLLAGEITTYAREKRYIRRDGSFLWANLTVSLALAADGRPAHFISVVEDITDRKRVEAALQRSERDLADFFDHATVGLHWVGPDGIILRANRAELNLLGYTRNEYIGRHIADFHADVPVIEEILQRLSCNEELHDYPARLRCKDGSIRDVLINSNVLWENGRFVHTRCFTRDITEQKRAEDRQRQQAEHARLLSGVSARLVLRSTDGKRESADELLESVFTDVMRYLDAEYYFNFVVGDEPDTLRLVSSAGLDSATRAPLHRIRFGEYLCGVVARTLQPLVIEDLQNCPLENAGAMCAVGVQAYAGYPMLTDGRLIGTISFATARRGRFKSEELDLIQSIADLLAAAVERDRLWSVVRDSEAKFRELADAMPQIVYVTDTTGQIDFVNRQWVEYTGQTEAHAADLGPVVHPDDLNDLGRRWEKAKADGTPLQAEFRLRRASDGEFRWFLTRSVPIRDAGGRVVQWYGTSTDIHDQKRAEEAVRASEQFHRLLVEAVPGMVWSANTVDGLDYLSRRWEEYTGLTLAQIREAGWEAVHHPDEVDAITARFADAAQSGQAFEMEFGYRRRDGEYRWHLGRQVPLSDPDGKGLRWVGTLIDVDDRKRAESVLRQGEARFRAAIEAVSSIVWTNNAQGMMVGEQFGWGKFTGQDRDSYQGYGWANAVHPDDAQPTLDAWKESVAEKKTFVFENRILRSDGQWRLCSVRAVPVFDNQGEISEWVGVNNDITDLKKAEEELRDGREQLDFALVAADLGQWSLNLADHTARRTLRHDQLFGYEALLPEWTYETFLAHVVPDDRAAVDADFQKAVATGSLWAVECRIRRADWAVRHIWTKALIRRDAAGQVDQMLGIVGDITDRRHAKERQTFLVKLADALRPLSDWVDLQAEASRVLGEHLGANRVVYFEICGDEYVIERDYTAGVQPLAGRYPIASFGQALLADLVDGRTIIEADATTQPDRPISEQAAFAAVQVRGHVDVSLVKGGRFVAGMTVQVADRRDWTTQEVALIEDTAERTWAAVERARAEAALHESEARYRAVVEGQSEMVCRFGVDGTIQFANGAYARALGTSKEALEGSDFWNLIPAADRPSVKKMLDGLTPDAPEVSIENRFMTKDGVRWMLWTNRGLRFDSDGRLLEAQSAGIDITDRRRAEASLRESEQRFRLVADAAPVLIWLRGTDKLCYWFNQPWLAFTGRSMEQEVGNGWAEGVHPDDFDRCLQTYIAAFDARTPFSMEYRLRRHDGEFRWLIDNGVPRYGADGEFDGYIGSCVDVTEYKNADAELRDADRRKDEFLATLAHELRNPLAPIRNGLQVMRLSGSDDSIVVEVRSMMERQLNQMIRLVDDLLDVSRITRDNLNLKKQQVELAAVIRSAVETSRPLIEQADHTITVTVPQTPIYLAADLTRLAQVFSNLLNNSAKYTPAGGRIWLVVEGFENEVAVTVGDNGLGIPAESLPQIFKMFSQVDRNMEMAQGGLGIGLTLVRRLIEMHGGTVEARSDGPGQGSEFTVRLPVLKLTQQPVTIAGNEIAMAKAQRRILVVDDNQDSAKSLALMLKLMGNEIHMSHDGLAAVHDAEHFRPDLILLDIGLPKLNGYDACRRIREQSWSRDLEIVALTGWGTEDDRRLAIEAGFDHHLVKPVELAALNQLLAAPETQSSSLQQTNPTQASLRVLVVDDRRDATHILRTLLTTIGHDVQTAADGPSALALALDFRPEVVLLDINMPGMSGLEVAKRIRQQSILKDIVLIAMTGHGDDEDRQRSIEAGFDFHLVKPADIKIVYEILATVKKK